MNLSRNQKEAMGGLVLASPWTQNCTNLGFKKLGVVDGFGSYEIDKLRFNVELEELVVIEVIRS